MEGILTTAYQGLNGNLIRQANPALSEEKVYELIYLTIKYHILRTQIAQLESGVKALERE